MFPVKVSSITFICDITIRKQAFSVFLYQIFKDTFAACNLQLRSIISVKATSMVTTLFKFTRLNVSLVARNSYLGKGGIVRAKKKNLVKHHKTLALHDASFFFLILVFLFKVTSNTRIQFLLVA